MVKRYNRYKLYVFGGSLTLNLDVPNQNFGAIKALVCYKGCLAKNFDPCFIKKTFF